MVTRLLLMLAVTLCLASTMATDATTGNTITIRNLSCEHQLNPLGIDHVQPRLSWIHEAKQRGARQTAYRILVASDTTTLNKNIGDVWDSEKVISEKSVLVPYQGKPLSARQSCVWKVMVWDQDDKSSPWSAHAIFEIGLPTAADWANAQWIRLADDPRNSPLAQRPVQTKKMNTPKEIRSFPAPLIRKNITVRPNVTRARAYICSLGLHEMYWNGQRIGNDVLQPAVTTYDERGFYCTYDVTSVIVSGPNAVGLALGNGFYGQNMGFPGARLEWGKPTVLARITTDYADGSSDTVVSDASWRASTGPVVLDNIYAGESYDARLEMVNWAQPHGDDHAWKPVEIILPPTKRVEAQMLDPCRRIEEIHPVAIRRTADGRWIADVGRNIAGWVRLTVTQPAGTQITMRFAEILAQDIDHLDPASTGVFATGVVQTDIYVCRGGGSESWEPRFTYHGFRYVEINGCDTQPDITGIVVNTALPSHGSFTCSDPLLNRIYQTSLKTIEGNIHGTTEDCPHRERCAWLGDAHAQAATTFLNYQAAPLFSKFMDDVETTLGREGKSKDRKGPPVGMPCNIAVGRRLCGEARTDWGAAVVLLPWNIYTYSGDDAAIRDHYPLMVSWVDHVTEKSKNNIVSFGYGDWCPPGGNEHMECPVPLSTTIFHCAELKLVADAARLLGKPSDAARFDADAQRFRAALNAKFFNEKTSSYGSQTANVLALRFGVEPDGQRQALGDALAREVTVRHQGHPFVGIHGGVGLYTFLGDAGHADVAMKAMTISGFPGFKFQFDAGMTTWPERYDNALAQGTDRSLNHPMQSGFAAWFHEGVGGIRVTEPGFRRFDVHPQLMRFIASARVTHQSPYGEILSAFERHGATTEWSVSIPVGCESTIWIPTDNVDQVREGDSGIAHIAGITVLRRETNAVVCRLRSGSYRFTTPLAPSP